MFGTNKNKQKPREKGGEAGTRIEWMGFVREKK